MLMCVGASHAWSAPPDSRNRDVTRIRATAAQVRDAAGIRSRGVCQTGNRNDMFSDLQPTPFGVRPQQRVPRGNAPPQLTFLSEESPGAIFLKGAREITFIKAVKTQTQYLVSLSTIAHPIPLGMGWAIVECKTR